MSVSKIIEKGSRRLPLEAVERMDDRIIDIPCYDVVHDGYLLKCSMWIPYAPFSSLMHSYKSYTIVSMKQDNSDEVSVHRRFVNVASYPIESVFFYRYSDFEWLVCQLIEKYPCCIIPPLPQKSILTNINQENQEFIEGRKRGLKLFLIKVFKHRDLRYAPEFVDFILKNDSVNFFLAENRWMRVMDRISQRSSSKTLKKTVGLSLPLRTLSIICLQSQATASSVTWFLESLGKVPRNIIKTNLIRPTQQAKREKTELDTQLENYNKHIEFLEQSMNEISKHVSQVAQVEKDQATMMVNVSVNLSELGNSAGGFSQLNGD